MIIKLPDVDGDWEWVNSGIDENANIFRTYKRIKELPMPELKIGMLLGIATGEHNAYTHYALLKEAIFASTKANYLIWNERDGRRWVSQDKIKRIFSAEGEILWESKQC